MIEIIFFIICVLAISIMAVCCYAAGVKMGKSLCQLQEVRASPIKSFLSGVNKKPSITKEDLRLATLLENIESYDGTEEGQKEIN